MFSYFFFSLLVESNNLGTMAEKSASVEKADNVAVQLDNVELYDAEKTQHVKTDEKMSVIQAVRRYPIAFGWCKFNTTYSLVPAYTDGLQAYICSSSVSCGAMMAWQQL